MGQTQVMNLLYGKVLWSPQKLYIMVSCRTREVFLVGENCMTRCMQTNKIKLVDKKGI